MKASKRGEIAALLARPSTEVRVWLCYGPDEAGARVSADALLAAFLSAEDPLARVDLSPQVLQGDPARLADEAAAVSMFGDARAIRVDGVGDGPQGNVRAAVAALLEAPAAGNPVVMVAGDLKDTSALVKLVSGTKAGAALRHFLPEGRDAAAIAEALCREAGLAPDAEVVAAVGRLVASNRELAAREVEKLAIYLDAAPAEPKTADRDALAAVGASYGEADFAAYAAAAAGGHAAEAAAELDRILLARAAVPAVRALARRFMHLAELGAAARGRSPRDVVEAQGRRIFWKDKPALLRELSLWSAAEAERALGKLAAAEIALKSGRVDDSLIAGQVTMEIARHAARSAPGRQSDL